MYISGSLLESIAAPRTMWLNVKFGRLTGDSPLILFTKIEVLLDLMDQTEYNAPYDVIFCHDGFPPYWIL